jgi:hypothetical protein
MVRIRYPFGLYFLGRPSAVWEPRNHLGSGEQAGEKTLLRVISLISFFLWRSYSSETLKTPWFTLSGRRPLKRVPRWPKVQGWLDSVDSEDLFTSVIVVGEIRRRIEKIRPTDSVFASQFELWLRRLQLDYQTGYYRLRRRSLSSGVRFVQMTLYPNQMG